MLLNVPVYCYGWIGLHCLWLLQGACLVPAQVQDRNKPQTIPLARPPVADKGQHP